MIDNQLDPRYFMKDYDETGDGRQTLYEILEGRRSISVRGQLDADTMGPSGTNDPYF